MNYEVILPSNSLIDPNVHHEIIKANYFKIDEHNNLIFYKYISRYGEDVTIAAFKEWIEVLPFNK